MIIENETSQITEPAITVKPVLAVDAILLKRRDYKNAISYKFDNRRVTVGKKEDGFIFEFRTIDHNYTPHANCDCIHGKLAITNINLSKEAAEIVMMSLAELMSFHICR
jgi:hypothetical protein